MKDPLDGAFAFSRYMQAQERTRTAYANYNHAAVNLELSRIKERAAEIHSQSWESIAEGKLLSREVLDSLPENTRSIVLRVVEYVVNNRIERE
jgi:hypothetical protein